jgi:hypothetical protein
VLATCTNELGGQLQYRAPRRFRRGRMQINLVASSEEERCRATLIALAGEWVGCPAAWRFSTLHPACLPPRVIFGTNLALNRHTCKNRPASLVEVPRVWRVTRQRDDVARCKSPRVCDGKSTQERARLPANPSCRSNIGWAIKAAQLTTQPVPVLELGGASNWMQRSALST